MSFAKPMVLPAMQRSTRKLPAPFRRFGCKCLAPMLLAFCMIPASIDCQRATDHVVPSSAGLSVSNPRGNAVMLNGKGLNFSNPSGSTQLRIHGYLQADGRLFAANLFGQEHNVLLFRRIRPLVEGTLGNNVTFRFMPDFGEGRPVIQEAYADLGTGPNGHVQVGKFKTPIGLEVLRSDRDLTFSERSLASDLIPIRDLGAQLEGSFLQNTVTCELGYFSGAPDGANANFEWRGGGEGVARCFVQPLAAVSSAPGRELGIGIAFSEGHKQNVLPTFYTIGQEAFLQYSPDAFADGMRRHISPHGYFFSGPFGLLAEYAISGQELTAGTAHRYLANHAWEVSTSMVLTGEKNTYEGIQPARSLDLSTGLRHWGALEIAFRHSSLDADPNTFPNFASPAAAAEKARESAVGVNWYINRHTKLVTDYEHTTFLMHAGGTIPLHTENVAMTRIQFTL